MPLPENVSQAVAAYNSKDGHWLKLAPVLREAKGAGVDLSDVGVTESYVVRMLRSLKFLEEQKQGTIEEATEKRINVDAIALVLRISNKFPLEIRKDKTEEILVKVLAKELSINDLKKISGELGFKKLSGKTQPSSGTPSQTEQQWVADTFIYIEKTLQMLISKYGYRPLRARHAKICDDLATQFRCVADLGYKKQWDTRKEGML